MRPRLPRSGVSRWQGQSPTPRIRPGHFPKEEPHGHLEPRQALPVIFTAVIAILVCALLAGFTDISWGANVVIGAVILAIGVLGVWMLDKRRPVAKPPAST